MSGGEWRAIGGYKTVAIPHDELMIEKVDVDQTEGARARALAQLIRVMNEAVATVVPDMICEIKEPELPLWFVPEKLFWFEPLRLYNSTLLRSALACAHSNFKVAMPSIVTCTWEAVTT